jgi:predicted RNase H-like HicB family nuclease
MANCIAEVHKEPMSDFGVFFPDFPSYITAGKNIDEARDMVKSSNDPHSGHDRRW